MIEADKEISIRLPWSTICRLACQASMSGRSLNDLCEIAIGERLLNLKFQELCDDPATTIQDLAIWADAHDCKINFELTPRADSAISQ